VGPQVVAVAVEEGGGAGEVRGGRHGRGGVRQCRAAGRKGGDRNASADTYGVAGGRGGGELAAILDNAAAYMAQMERLYAVDRGWRRTTAMTAAESGGARPLPPAATALPASIVRRWRRRRRWRRKRSRGRWTAMATTWPMAMGGQSRTATTKMATRAPHPAPGGRRRRPPRQPRGGIGIIPHEASWIITTTARLIVTDPVVVAKLRTAVAAAAAAEAAGTATEKNGGGGNTKAEENLHL
jgi:hypothetical protein